MISNNSTESQASSLPDAQAGTAGTPGSVLDPHSPIEVASTGNGTTTDPSGTDTRQTPPPPYFDLSSLA